MRGAVKLAVGVCVVVTVWRAVLVLVGLVVGGAVPEFVAGAVPVCDAEDV